MSICNTFGSFAIYLAVILIISESPVSAFTIRWTRTTTLKPSIDLTGQESALLEVKHDIPKTNNGKGNIFQKVISSTSKDMIKTEKEKETPTRTSRNSLKFEKGSNKMTSTTTMFKSNKNLQPFHTSTKVTTPINDSTQLVTSPSTIINGSRTKLDDTIKEKKINSRSEQTTVGYAIKNNDQTTVNKIKGDKNNIDLTTEVLETTTQRLAASSQRLIESTPQNSNILDTSNTKMTNDPSTTTDMTIMASESHMFNTGTENVVTDIKESTETMVVEASSYMSTNPSWKKYTNIERGYTKPLKVESFSTEAIELLMNAETVPIKTTLENVANITSITSLKKLNQQLTTNAETNITRNNESATSKLVPTDPSIINSSGSATLSLNTATDNVVESKRAGFIDLTAKQNDTEVITTTDNFTFNETELIGAMFEAELNENDSSDIKNGSESQSQLVDDEMKDKLLEEQVLNDDLVKTYQKQSSQGNFIESKKNLPTEDSLSVKPINPKVGLYTVSPNYKKMKKIEVQPLKPFIRDPDDNSWRNESLSLLGIVFKAKNASKPFTQVLKNKTEAVLSIAPEKDDKNEVTELRERLEKSSQVRKSRKKKINKAGETIYTDYEESNSGESLSTLKPDTTMPLFNADGKLAFIGGTSISTVGPESTTLPGVYIYKEDVLTTRKPKKNKFAEYYDTTDEYDADYLTLPKLDLKKFTTSFYNKDTVTTPPIYLTTHAKTLNTNWPDRKPTVQYFPPKTEPQKVSLNDYDSDFEKKVNMFSFKEPPINIARASAATARTVQKYRLSPQENSQAPPIGRPDNSYKNFYVTFPPRAVEPSNRYSVDDESYNRASYVIKHFKDLIDEAVKGDYDKNGEFVQSYTNSPLTGVTIDEMTKGKQKSSMDDDYDYASNFHKEILNKFVDNFNQNSERFKADFPILYNNSVVHGRVQDSGRVVASSTASLKRQYGPHESAPHEYSPHEYSPQKPCRTNCDLKVELSPAYELHYYVPEQEEKEEVELKPATIPYTYRL
ncbi:unnamed protein product [Diatraea saccharalis]|uniref:Uncharacterized protein n=1 Tax=Diatraea saccharalis TaxID=40085 RepID=A0A9P0G1J9_9NEOP|nr:unnamed protein product [Diatraea saccharalis]